MGNFIKDLEKSRPQGKSWQCRSTGQSFEIVKHLIIAENLKGNVTLLLNDVILERLVVDNHDVDEFVNCNPNTTHHHIQDLIKRIRKEGFKVIRDEDEDEYVYLVQWGPYLNK